MKQITKTWTYRHDEILTQRPYGVDVDENDWLWEGCASGMLVAHNLRTAQLRIVPLPQLGREAVYHIFAWQGKLVLTLGHCPHYLVFDPATGECAEHSVPVANPIVWYGTKTPNGKVLLYERSESKVLVLDAPEAKPRVIQCPYPGQLASGKPFSDGLIYSALTDPARVIRFDPVSEKFVDELAIPFPEATPSGTHEHDGIAYWADSSRGRLLALELKKRKWLDPVATPDYRKVYGYMGGSFSFQGVGYFCLSTYAHSSRLDPKTAKIITPEGPLAIDGKPPRFLDRFLVFDPETMSFDYLVAPAQPDGVPLLCYTWADEKRFAITGLTIPYKEPGELDHQFGPWMILQSEPADAEPGFGSYQFNFDLQKHVRQYRRSYPRNRSLYIPSPPWTMPISNAVGPATEYPPGKDAELLRRAERTNAKQYWQALVETLLRDVTTDADRVKVIEHFVRTNTYYNPIQEPTHGHPIALLEGHDVRCGHAKQMLCTIFEHAGIQSRPVELNHHTVAEAFYDGSWHVADALFFGSRQPSRDGRVLSIEELKADPYFADGWAQDCFAYDPEVLLSEDGFQLLGYVFGPWGSYPYYSYYLWGDKEHPPTIPTGLPALRENASRVLLRWSESARFGGGAIEYDVRVFGERNCETPIFRTHTHETSVSFDVPEQHRMYFVEVRAMDDHRKKNPNTWYPAGRSNFVLVPADAYGWYGVL
jgi:hypothetical protein